MINRDLALIQDPSRLHSNKDLAEITELEQERKCWKGLTSQIEKVTKCHRLRTGTRNGSKSSKSGIMMFLALVSVMKI